MSASKRMYEEQRQRDHGEPQPLSLTSQINGIQPGRQGIADAAQAFITRVRDGHMNPLEVALKLRYLKDVQDKVEKELRPDILAEIAKHGRSAFLYGAEVVPMEAGTKYDYTLCGDTVLNELLDEQEKIMAKVKERQDFLKKVPADGLEVVNEVTGEVTRVMPPTKTSTSTFKVGWR